MQKSNFRFYIRVRQSLGVGAKTIHDELKSFAPRLAPSYSTVKLWYRKFKRGQKTVDDNARSGRPITQTTQNIIEIISKLIEEDPYITYDELEAESLLCRTTLHRIIHKHLKLRKITSRWVPYNLTQKNKDDRVRICQENLDKFKSGKWRLYDVLTGDESWFYLKQIKRKQSNKSWIKPGQSPRTVVRRGRFDAKFMSSLKEVE